MKIIFEHPPNKRMLLGVNYYDDYGRVIQVKSQNHLLGTDVVDNVYEFDGTLISSTRTHTVNGISTTIANTFTYDHMGRAKTTSQSINGAAATVLSNLSYNELGQLKEKKLHNGLQTNAYTYNERGWLKSSNAKVTATNSLIFSIELGYNSGGYPQFNGNISGQSFMNNDFGTFKSFTYQYDKLNRLIKAEISSTELSEVLSYDKIGNIASLNRDNTGVKTYNYENGGKSNRLSTISGLTGSYEYDDNGNARLDGRNGVSLSYNHLNLPITASKTVLGVNTVNLVYTYDAMGTKLRKYNGIGMSETVDYVRGIQYKPNGMIDFIQTEEGIARENGGSYSYEWSCNIKVETFMWQI